LADQAQGELRGAVAKFENGRERGWTGSDLPRGTQPEDRANPPVFGSAENFVTGPSSGLRAIFRAQCTVGRTRVRYQLRPADALVVKREKD
jgi:hypothetical protein